MKPLLAICLIAVVLSMANQAHSQDFPIMCRHQALLSASVMVEHYPVRFAVGKRNKVSHVEAQALIDGTWRFVRMVNGKIEVLDALYQPEGNGFYVDHYLGWREYLVKWSFTNPKDANWPTDYPN